MFAFNQRKLYDLTFFNDFAVLGREWLCLNQTPEKCPKLVCQSGKSLSLSSPPVSIVSIFPVLAIEPSDGTS